jgi:hypothetical protein
MPGRTIAAMEEEARAAFAFLETEFGCVVEPGEHESWWRRLLYRCDTGAAEVYLDERDEMVSVYVAAVGEEKLPLWAILEARGERPPESDIDAWADALRRHGTEALRGDTSGYSGTEEAIERRGAELDRFVHDTLDEIRAKRKRGR